MGKREVKPVTGRTEMVGPPGRIVVKDEDVARMELKGYVVIEETHLPVNHSEPEPADAPADDGADGGAGDKICDGLESKTVKELQKIAEAVGLSGRGSKAAIIERIKAKQGDGVGIDTGGDPDAGADDAPADDGGSDPSYDSAGGDSE